ncbi:MAG: hypothetical protein HC852_01440 [Acaryochloridaceae cyanobacterium RU_4_10]|nr:hypothetical protein [Acaryochloridaceae cyanobacterium RU_4_10]
MFDILLKFLKGIAYDWIVALIGVIKLFHEWFKKLFRPKPPHSDTNATNTGCATVDHPSFHRPDPLIYSQQYLLSLGLAVTWDNPDISLFRNGVQVPEGELLPNTEYEIRATIWNNSYDAPIVSMPVDFSFMSFGVTTFTTPIGSTVVDLGVKGGSQHPAIASVPWITPPVGHYCIIVEFKWADDANPNNNVGQNNTNVVTASSPATFTFTVRNQEEKERAYRIEADTYTLPERDDCSEIATDRRDNVQKWKELQVQHNRASHPVPSRLDRRLQSPRGHPRSRPRSSHQRRHHATEQFHRTKSLQRSRRH